MRKPSRPQWVQVLIVVLVGVVVFALSWITQYTMTRALQRPGATRAPAAR
ncbi:MAG: hypothetical protein ABL986_18230 [Vicinamibacterales bacterium]